MPLQFVFEYFQSLDTSAESAHLEDPIISEAEAGEYCQIYRVNNKASLGYLVRLCLRKNEVSWDCSSVIVSFSSLGFSSNTQNEVCKQA